MKTNQNYPFIVVLILLFVTLFHTNLVAQEKSKKELKELQKLEKQKQITLLVESKEFVFKANRMVPQGGRTIHLTPEYFTEFHSELVKCDLPFIGRGYSGTEYAGSDGGIKFEEKPTVYSIEKKKKYYFIKADVRGDRDSYSMILTVYFEGSATLSVNSNNKSSISYEGEIEKFIKDDDTKK